MELFEIIETEKHLVIVMEYCTGGTLSAYVSKRKRLCENVAKNIFKNVISGLHYLHQNGIAHRDIKLENILLNADGDTKIADFGESLSFDLQNGIDSELCGFQQDIQCTGSMLFTILYGEMPFQVPKNDENEEKSCIDQLFDLYHSQNPNLKSDVSEEARNMIRGLLESNFEKQN